MPMYDAKNAGTWDRVLRLAIGLIMLIVGWGNDRSWDLALRVFALYPLITGLTGWCPVYALLRAGTRKSSRN